MWMPVFPRDIDFALATAVAGVALLLVVMLNLAAAKSVQPKKIAWLLKARELIVELIREKHCHPLLVRLAWHDAGTYDQQHAHLPWPAAGGAIGSVRFSKELNAAPNGGLSKGVGLLEPIKLACPDVSWADLIQMASATAIELAGGPRIPMRYGRLDADSSPEQSVEPFGLPEANPSEDPAAHLRWVFGKYGMGDKEIVALSGAHTLGRAFKERSGAVPNGAGEEGATKYTGSACCPMGGDAKAAAKFMPGGKSWTPNWLRFDNSYFSLGGKADPDSLIAFPTDRVLETDPGFKPFFDKYAASEAAFFADYAAAHARLSEQGSKFSPPEGIRL
ncbi:hypothetical protein KFE25_003339 [Diacronema lutheri]|uniref:Plant heme peroxidase family profile domain-containing protein n=1 Tax=Diacronema lutheri TaxID=2081491 RepID=A0A8J5X9J3_DIALT|nr:hypothetical protein KFE25_003339 [Diacronema lutheri]